MLILFIVAAIFGIFIDCLIKKRKLKKFYLIILAMLFSFVAANRLISVPDTEAYIEYFNVLSIDIQQNGLLHYTEIFEIGFEMLSRLLLVCGFGHRSIFFIFAFIVSLLGQIVFNDREFPIIVWLLFISFYGIYFSFVILRAGISIMCFCTFIKYIKTKKCGSVISLIVAILFHKSVLFPFLIYLLINVCRFKKSFKREIIVLIVLTMFYVFSVGNMITIKILNYLNNFIQNSLWDRFSYYLQDFETKIFNISFRLMFNLLIYVFAEYVRYKNKNLILSSTDFLMNKLIYLGLCLELFCGSNTVIGRIVDYLFIFNVYNLIFIIKYLSTYKKYRKYSPVPVASYNSNNTLLLKKVKYRVVIMQIVAISFLIVNLFFILRIILR